MRRHLVEELEFNAPEIRGDRFWHIIPEDEASDVLGVSQIIVGLVNGIFNVPNADFDVGWEVLEQ